MGSYTCVIDGYQGPLGLVMLVLDIYKEPTLVGSYVRVMQG